MLRNEFNEKPNDGSVKKTDVEKLARKCFPMFDLDNLIQSLVPNVIVFFGSYIEMEFHDSLGEELFCGACETFDEDLAPREWHNH